MKSETFSPKAFLKERRPERFSDTVSKEVTELDRSLLEYHLSSLTSRSQETDFERFARQLCEREICPNLLPQTGPTGGGDSKVDSETYPVADSLTLAWYIGIGREASNERWAFAFSAKQDWPPKVRSDVKKIVDTGRGYSKAFFVTNQAVSDKKRAAEEDTLRTEYKIDVRILDRTWILNCVFKGKHEALAIKELGVTGLSDRKKINGPLDVKREEELNRIEERIQEAIQIGRINSSLVDDALEAANLARNIERPRAEVEGRYSRANDLATNYGSLRQKVETAYQWAWTLHWWYEDYDAFLKQYSKVEKLTIGSYNVYDLERLTNLWFCLFTSVIDSVSDAQFATYEIHTKILGSELQRLQNEQDRPSTALQAETLSLHVQITRNLANKHPIDDLLHALQDVVLRSVGLVGYPLEPLVEIVTELGKVVDNSVEYNKLFETIIEITSARDGEVRAATMLLSRGKQQIHQNRYVEAIATLGRALQLLYKHETRYDLIRALYLCGCAYGEMGLLWAARGTFLFAANLATNEFWQYGDITPHQAACYKNLKWIELSLGRLPYILCWHELNLIICQMLSDRNYDIESLSTSEDSFELLLTRLLLRTDFMDLKYLASLPDALDKLGLTLSSDALLYALGYENRLEETSQKLGKDPLYFASLWQSLEADVPLANQPELCNQQTTILCSRILGCQITAKSKTQSPCIEVAESILASLESFLATGTLNRAITYEPELTIDVEISHFTDSLINVAIEERAGHPHLKVRCKLFNPHKLNPNEQVEIRKIIADIAMKALAHIVLFKDIQQDLEALFRDEQVSQRAFSFTSTFGTQANVLGELPKTQLAAWIDNENNTYPLCRTIPWKPLDIETDNNPKNELPLPYPTQSQETPPELLNPNLMKHNEMTTVSVIRHRLWDKAGWNGVGYLINKENIDPPIFALIFENQEAGKEIFTQWHQELGKSDIREQLRITIIRGINRTNPHIYRVIIGTNPMLRPEGNKFITLISRVHTMEPSTSNNLNQFIEAYKLISVFYIAPAFMMDKSDWSRPPHFETSLSIKIKSINIREAWEIGRGDIDAVYIRKDDTPIIPQNAKNAPVLDILTDYNTS